MNPRVMMDLKGEDPNVYHLLVRALFVVNVSNVYFGFTS